MCGVTVDAKKKFMNRSAQEDDLSEGSFWALKEKSDYKKAAQGKPHAALTKLLN